MIDVDVERRGTLPYGGASRYVDKQLETPVKSASRSHLVIGASYVHTVIGDHSWGAYAGILGG